MREHGSRRAVTTVMRSVAALLALVTLAPTTADASSCAISDFTTTIDPPIDCPLVVYRSPYGGGYHVEPPLVTVVRGNDVQAVTTSLIVESRTVSIAYYQLDCDGIATGSSDYPQDYEVYTITVTGAQPGDRISVDGMDAGVITASRGGLCEESPQPTQACTLMASDCDYDYDDDEPSSGGLEISFAGCNAGTDGGLALSLLVLGALGYRRRVRR
jgi:uncharacterized protein (TIGR03382 family)